MTLFGLLLGPALAAGPAVAPAKPPAADPLTSLVEAERAFARTCVEKGIRASFLEFFADDGVAFHPAPENARQALLAQSAPPARPPVTLDWEPIAADIAAGGDLGWTTGPYTFGDDTGKQPPSHGYYFSVWRKQPDGAWKVAADLGTSTPPPAASAPRPGFRPAHAAPTVASAGALGREALLDLDRELSRACGSSHAGDCLGARLDDQVRLHREGLEPLVGRAASRAFLEKGAPRLSFEPLGGGVARSGDLAFTYGRYEARSASEGPTAAGAEAGYYLRVWRRGTSGWRIAADVAKAAPPGKSP